MADKPNTTDVSANAQYLASTFNSNFSIIEDAIENCLGRGGTAESPNSMEGDLDMDLNDILNVGAIDTTSLTINGNVITVDNSAVSALPDQSGKDNYLLTTNGTTASWLPTVYDTVSDMVASSDNVIGTLVTTKGYYTVGDGGGATYLIVASGSYVGTPDEYSDLTTASGSIAVYQVKEFNFIKQFGAVGDGTTDDTDAIQAAVDKVIGASKRLDFDEGPYLISSEITVDVDQLRRFGLNGSKTRIIQDTDNTPIFAFEGDNVRQFYVKGFIFEWSSNQADTNTLSYGISFDTLADTNAGFYNFELSDLEIVNGYYLMGQSQAAGSYRVPIWGLRATDWTMDNTTSGGLARLISPSVIGMPNSSFNRMYANATSSDNPIFNATANVNISLRDIEINEATTQVIVLTTCDQFNMENIRVEKGTWATDLSRMVNLSNSTGKVDGFYAGNMTINVATKMYVFDLLVASIGVELTNIDIDDSITDTSGELYVVKCDNTPCRLGNVFIPTSVDLRASGFVGIFDWNILATRTNVQIPHYDSVSADNGDAGTTIIATYDEATQLWDTALTTGRVVSTSLKGAFEGAKFRIVRTSNSTGASNLNVQNLTPSTIKALATGEWCDITFTGSNWIVTAYGSL